MRQMDCYTEGASEVVLPHQGSFLEASHSGKRPATSSDYSLGSQSLEESEWRLDGGVAVRTGPASYKRIKKEQLSGDARLRTREASSLGPR